MEVIAVQLSCIFLANNVQYVSVLLQAAKKTRVHIFNNQLKSLKGSKKLVDVCMKILMYLSLQGLNLL